MEIEAGGNKVDRSGQSKKVRFVLFLFKERHIYPASVSLFGKRAYKSRDSIVHLNVTLDNHIDIL